MIVEKETKKPLEIKKTVTKETKGTKKEIFWITEFYDQDNEENRL